MRIFIERAAKEVMSNCGEEKGRDEGSLVSLHIALARTARSSSATTSPSLAFDAAPPTAAVSEFTPNSDGEDQVERISGLFNSHLVLVDDVRELYKERVALERDYAAKLQVLTKKAADKKAKTETAVVIGDDPTKAWNERTMRQSTLNTAYDALIKSLTDAAQDHVNIADAVSTQVIEVLKGLERKNEESMKKEMAFYQKLLADRDRTYNDRIKNKNKYDEECAEVDVHRQKQASRPGRAQDDKHAERAARQADQQRVDMLNSKNNYLISTAVANRAKAKFFEDDLPSLEDVKGLLTRLVQRFSKILLHAQALESAHLDTLKGRVGAVEAAFNGVDTGADQQLFIEYNIRPFAAPPDFKFEPCTNYYDTDEMSVEEQPKIYLQNKLVRSRGKLAEVDAVVDAKRREAQKLRDLVGAYSADHSLGNIDDISDNYLEAYHQLVFFSTSQAILNAEVDTIVAAVGNDTGAMQPHTFKSSSFSIPTQCGYCKSSIWGLSKQGKTCKACGLSVHAKCELKVPSDCPGSKGARQSTLGRSPTSSSQASASSRTSAASRASRMPPPEASPSSFVRTEETYEESYPTARVVFDFTPSSEFELAVREGTLVSVVEPDDGSGWVKVADGSGKSGLVPASYIEAAEEEVATPAAQQHYGSGKYVRALYDYQAGGSDELPLRDGELYELSSGPSGGQNYGDGWWEGFDTKGRKGIFPSNYVSQALPSMVGIFTKGEPYFEDGNLILATHDTPTLFKVHRGVLARHSEVFQDMFAFPPAQYEAEMLDGCQVVVMHDLPLELGHLIKALYDGPHFGNESVADFLYLAGILRLATKYFIGHLRLSAVRHLVQTWATTLKGHDDMVETALHAPIVDNISYPYAHPLLVLNLCHEVNVRIVLPSALYFLSLYRLDDIMSGDHPKLAAVAEHPSKPSAEFFHYKEYALILQFRIDIILDFVRRFCSQHTVASDCRQSTVCQRALNRLASRLSRSWTMRTGPFHYMKQAVTEFSEDSSTCTSCKRRFQQEVQEHREQLWKELPLKCCLPPWEQLEAEELSP
ncbi:hypothetical protein FB107DRAFT_203028 [Schizophyllum commune]